MSEVITIDTQDNVIEQFRVEPLPLYTEDYYLLREVMPELDVSELPNIGVSRFISRLKMTMKLYSGVGLSANQCGVKKRIFVIGSDDFQMACINPKIVQYYGSQAKMNEGCLSSPGLYVKIPRYESVEVEYYDENGKLTNTVLDGITAQCFQHELDHLNGVSFIKRAGETSLMMARKKQNKLIKKIKRSQ
jgi:peptide deformylase